MHEMKQVSFQKYAKHDRQTSSFAGRLGVKYACVHTPSISSALKKDKSGLESEWSWLSKSGF